MIHQFKLYNDKGGESALMNLLMNAKGAIIKEVVVENNNFLYKQFFLVEWFYDNSTTQLWHNVIQLVKSDGEIDISK